MDGIMQVPPFNFDIGIRRSLEVTNEGCGGYFLLDREQGTG
jgi:hypothetical protein